VRRRRLKHHRQRIFDQLLQRAEEFRAQRAVDPCDFPLLIELGLPGLVTVVIQWWLVRRHLARTAARAALVPAEG
jgi:hypothetical protein